jgi:hypothetical protein
LTSAAGLGRNERADRQKERMRRYTKGEADASAKRVDAVMWSKLVDSAEFPRSQRVQWHLGWPGGWVLNRGSERKIGRESERVDLASDAGLHNEGKGTKEQGYETGKWQEECGVDRCSIVAVRDWP